MKKIIIYLIIAAVLLSVSLLGIITLFTMKLDKKTNDYKEYLGKEIIMNKDTLIITDYSVFEGTFIMNDGSSVNKELVKKLLDERNIKY